MDKEVYRDESNSWVAPLPFRQSRQRLPNNREKAVQHFASLQRSLKKETRGATAIRGFHGKNIRKQSC